jgi:hypothetical protein
MLGGSQKRYYGGILKFHNSCQFERSLNVTFVSLIPKMANAVEVSPYQFGGRGL